MATEILKTDPDHEWTPETRAEALRLIDEGNSNKAVASIMSGRLGRRISVYSVVAILPKRNARGAFIERKCLKCAGEFKTDSRFIRLCDTCRKSANDAGML